jgi:menaquinone-dependent protoporphyrinogen IX oxidase
MNSNESKAYVGNASRKTRRKPEDEEVFIGILDLDMLSMKDKISRFCGNLKTLYVEKEPEYDDWKDVR